MIDRIAAIDGVSAEATRDPIAAHGTCCVAFRSFLSDDARRGSIHFG